MSNPSMLFIDWMLIQVVTMIVSAVILGKAQSQKIQLLLLGSFFHGALSIALFGSWQFVMKHIW